MLKFGTSILFSLIILSPNLCVTFSQAQTYEPWTGAVVGANINLGNNEVLKNIRLLINQGKTGDAVREAEKFVYRVTSPGLAQQTSRFYYDGYNALCISLTAHKEYERAMTACDTAVQNKPTKWIAINSRGSLNYKMGNFSAALNDYRKALENAPNTEHITRILEHNIKISEARVSSDK